MGSKQRGTRFLKVEVEKAVGSADAGYTCVGEGILSAEKAVFKYKIRYHNP